MKKILFILFTAIFVAGNFSALAFAQHTSNDNCLIRVRTYVSDNGWMGPFHDAQIAGTVGKAKAIEAISLSVLDGHNVQYRVYIKELGWSNWASRGQEVGAIDEGLYISGIQIKSDNKQKRIVGRVHISYIGWVDISDSEQIIGDMKNNIEALELRMEDRPKDVLSDF